METNPNLWKRTLFGSAIAMVFVMGTAASAPVSVDMQLLNESADPIFTLEEIETQAWTGTCAAIASESEAVSPTCVELPGRMFTVRMGPSADTRYLIVGPTDNKRPDLSSERALVVGPTDNKRPDLSSERALVVGPTDNKRPDLSSQSTLIVGPTDNRSSGMADELSLIVGPTDNRGSSASKARTLIVGPTDNRYRTLDPAIKASVAANLLDASGQDSLGIWLVLDVVSDHSLCVIVDLGTYRGGPILATEYTSIAAELGLYMVELGVAPADIDLAELVRVAEAMQADERSMESVFDAAEVAVDLWMADACHESSELVGQLCSALR